MDGTKISFFCKCRAFAFPPKTLFTITELISWALNWSRAMLDESTVHGNDVMMAQFAFSFSAHDFPRNFN